MKFAFLLTLNCNLACQYCYIQKNKNSIDIKTATKAVDFIFEHSNSREQIDIGFFGGEPLLEFKLLKEVTHLIEAHPKYPEREMDIQVTTNGTIFSEEIADFLIQHNITMGISCDGFPMVQDYSRKFSDGRPSGKIVEENLKKAIAYFPNIMVNAVYSPTTYKYLPDSIDYFYNLGIRRIFLNPDYSANWSVEDIPHLQEIYNTIAKKFCYWHNVNDPAFISLINSKLIVILKDGYDINEHCQMGKKEFAIAPNGNVFPCERLVGDGSANEHCIGNIHEGVNYKKICSNKYFAKPAPTICSNCTLKKYCMNWCGCSNYFSTGNYNQAGPFICASEKAAIKSAFSAFEELDAKYGASVISKLTENNCQEKQIPTVTSI